MLCDVCKEGVEGIWDPSRTKRVGKFEELEAQWGSSDEPKDGFAKYWSSLPEDRDNFADLDPSECFFIHHKTAASFMASVHDGCAMCNYFYRWGNIDIPSSLQEEEEDSGCYFSVFSMEIDWEHSYFWIHIFAKTDRALNFAIGAVDIKADRNINFDFEASTNSASTWSIINDWMENCTESHQACRQPDLATSYRPTRLLQMNEANSFRLVKGSECPTGMHYAALSYCWGSKPAHSLLRLLRSTMSGLSEWQPVGGLPRTFRDAMNIAQRLGIHYLWIDRLCIFQDSAEDWRHEASTMQDVYRNAYIGIGALGAKDDEGGCFFERDPAKVGPAVLSLKLEPDGKRMNFMCDEENFYSWRYTFENEPLCQRSWVVQERLLAPRTLYFGAKQVFWECRARTCCEMHPKGMDPYRGKAGEAPDEQLWKQLLATRQSEMSGSDRPQLFIDWDVIVEYYASLQLTMASDKLVALSGLANDMKKRLNEVEPGPHRYLAGLWEDELMSQLTWHVRDGLAKRTSQYRAPSWSWACLDGHVFPGLGLMRGKRVMGEAWVIDIATAISARMSYPSKEEPDQEETGQVESGILTLEGPYIPARLYACSRSVAEAMSDMISLEPMDGLPRAFVRFDSVDDTAEEALVFWTSMSRSYIRGLALALVEGDRYRRLGLATIDWNNDWSLTHFVAKLPRRQVRII